jgi:hypothetical protein
MAAVDHLAAYARAHDVHRLRLETGIHQHADHPVIRAGGLLIQ